MFRLLLMLSLVTSQGAAELVDAAVIVLKVSALFRYDSYAAEILEFLNNGIFIPSALCSRRSMVFLAFCSYMHL